jgi:hypothetical protein
MCRTRLSKYMATKKTSIFTLTERLTIDAALNTKAAVIDLSSYVDVGDRQAVQVHSVDFIFQGTGAGSSVTSSFAGSGMVSVQVQDLNRGALQFADDRALVASGHLQYDQDAFLSTGSDMFPDNFGKGSDDGRYVVNDALYVYARSTTLTANEEINVTVRVNASIVSLTAKDFMAIAIQSTAADN